MHLGSVVVVINIFGIKICANVVIVYLSLGLYENLPSSSLNTACWQPLDSKKSYYHIVFL